MGPLMGAVNGAVNEGADGAINLLKQKKTVFFRLLIVNLSKILGYPCFQPPALKFVFFNNF